MCYSEEQSKKSFAINLITSYILYQFSKDKIYKVLALFFAFVGLMQLFDIVFWKTQDLSNPTNANINYITTKIAMFANHLQPIFLAYVIYMFIGSLGIYSKAILLIYTIMISLYTIHIYKNINHTKTFNINSYDNKIKSSLNWEWNSQDYSEIIYFVFVLTLSILVFENFEYPVNIILFFINILSFIFASFYHKNKATGRFWCKFAAWVPLFFLVFNK